MCGRYTFTPDEKFYERYQIKNRLEKLPFSFNVAPGQIMPVIINQKANQLRLMKWGLIPFWAKDPQIGYKMINARVETLGQKPSFKKPLQFQRCLIPATGFYEWQKAKSGKIPFYIKAKSNKYLSFAGLYDFWKDEKGKVINSYTIITKEAESAIRPIHPRMPVILIKDQEKNWLEHKNDISNLLKEITNSTTDLTFYPVSRLVNKVENDNNENLIKKIKL